MKRCLLVVALLGLFACHKDKDATPPPDEAQSAAAKVMKDELPVPEGVAGKEPSRVEEIGTLSAPDVKVTPALVEKYLAYRTSVVEKGRAAVEKFQQESAEAKKNGEAQLNVSKRAAEFAVRMRAIEEKARENSGMSRDEVVATGQLISEVFAARQIWKMNGGDEALEKARAKVASMPAKDQTRAKVALARSEKSFDEMKNASRARKRFGDEAVDAVLKQEDALWKVQQDGAKVMSAVY